MVNIFPPEHCSIELYTENALLSWLSDYGVEYTSDPDKPGFMLYEVKHIHETGKIPAELSPNILDRIKRNELKIVLFYAREPVNYNLIEEYLPAFTSAGIKYESLRIVTGNFNQVELDKFPNGLKVIPFFMFDLQTKLSYFGRDEISREPEYKFLCYNGVMKLHRTLLYLMLPKSEGYVSYLKRKYVDDKDLELEVDNCKSIPVDLAQESKQEIYTEGCYVDLTLGEYIENQFGDNYELYDKTAFSIVSESIVDTWSVFATEKTFKAILSMHPFLLVSSPGTVDLLRAYGYRTYDFLFGGIDELDQEPDTFKKINMVCEIVKSFSMSKYIENIDLVYETAKYNRDLCHNNNYNKRLKNLLKELSDENTDISARRLQ